MGPIHYLKCMLWRGTADGKYSLKSTLKLVSSPKDRGVEFLKVGVDLGSEKFQSY